MITQRLLEQVEGLRPKDRAAAYEMLGTHEFQACAEDLLYWMDSDLHGGIPYVYTQDPHAMYACTECEDGEAIPGPNRVHHVRAFHNGEVKSNYEAAAWFKALPSVRAWPAGSSGIMKYVKPISRAWLSEPFICVEKSRDMMATWMVVAFYTWETIFHEGKQNFFQSEDASKTYELVRRANFIYEHQPRWLRERVPFRFTKGSTKAGVFECPERHSSIEGFAQGGDQIRQYHPSGLFLDEAAYQTKAQDAFTAVKPALQNGGRFTAVSSANPSYFMLLCTDQTNEDSELPKEVEDGSNIPTASTNS